MAEAMTTDTRSAILPAELAAALFADAHMVTFEAGQTLFLGGDPCTGSYQLIEGHLKVTLDLPSGRERILALVGPGALVGELSVIDGTPRSAGVIAIRAAKLRFARGRRRRGPAYVDGSASILERWLINRRKLSRYTTEEILRLAQQGDLLIRGWGGRRIAARHAAGHQRAGVRADGLPGSYHDGAAGSLTRAEQRALNQRENAVSLEIGR